MQTLVEMWNRFILRVFVVWLTSEQIRDNMIVGQICTSGGAGGIGESFWL